MYVIRIEAFDDLEHPGCPICRTCARVGREWLRGLLQNDIGDSTVRTSIADRGGLCGNHVRVLVDVATEDRDTLGLALVLEFLLNVAKRSLLNPAQRPKPLLRGWSRLRRGGAPPRAGPEPSCGACEAEDRRADAYLALFMDPSDPQMRALVDDPRHALCRDHLAQALGTAADNPNTRLLKLAATRKLDLLLAQIGDSIRAHRVGSDAPSSVHDVLRRQAPDWLTRTRADEP